MYVRIDFCDRFHRDDRGNRFVLSTRRKEISFDFTRRPPDISISFFFFFSRKKEKCISFNGFSKDKRNTHAERCRWQRVVLAVPSSASRTSQLLAHPRREQWACSNSCNKQRAPDYRSDFPGKLSLPRNTDWLNYCEFIEEQMKTREAKPCPRAIILG